VPLEALAPTATERIVLAPESRTPPSTRADRGHAVCIAVGPEGGLDASELDALAAAGFEAVAFGPRVLRAETAAIAATAWLQARRGDLLSANRD
jgi:16S rRNA (uracil1498-N3)-methyltransferase